jgi:capsular exopolysaccharide synthesis family protein
MKNNSSLTKRERNQPPLAENQLMLQAIDFLKPAEKLETSRGEHLRDYWTAIRRHLLLVASIAILSTLAIAAYEARQPDQYEAVARIEIGHEDAVPGLAGSPNSVNVSSSSDDSIYFNTQLQILTSLGLVRRVVKTLDLEHNESFLRPNVPAHSTWNGFLNMFGVGNKEPQPGPKKQVLLVTSVAPATAREDLDESKRLEPYVNYLLRGLKVEPIKETRTDVRETRLIDITFAHSNPQITVQVVNTVADAAAYMNMERKSQKSVVAGEFLEKRIAELQSQIRAGEQDLLSYAQNNKIISLDPSQNPVAERLTGLNRELLEAENDRSQAESGYRAAQLPDAADALARDTAKQTGPEESKVAELRQRRVQLLVENTEEWPEVKEIDKQIAELEKQIKDQRQNAAATMLKTLETRYRQTLAREETLRSAFNEQSNITVSQNEAAINYRITQQKVETDKGILSALLQHAKENDIARASLSNSVHVIDYATVPDRPVSPKRLRNVGMAFLISLGFAIGCALMREYFDNTFHSLADVERKSSVPALALVPSARNIVGNGVLPQVRSSVGENHQDRPELLLHHPNPILSEVYQHLRVSLLLSRNGNELRSLLITSSLPGEGKTTTAINTAITLAETDAKVLLVDADLRRPSLHKIFDVDNEHGLTTALNDGLSDSEILSLIKKTKGERLSLLTSGPLLTNPSRLFDHERMHQLISTLQPEFTHIVIDSPPIVTFADSVILSTQVDGVLMVVHGGKSPQEIVLRSMKLLDDVDASVLGVVLNNTKVQPSDGYYGSYSQQY